MIAMQELVVPKSIPKTLAIIENFLSDSSSPTNGLAPARLWLSFHIP
jgi:hypothetical protein